MKTVALDPEGHEIAALREFAPELRGGRVLEVGCGDGRLTFRYAADTASVLAIDPDETRIANARRRLAVAPWSHVEFRQMRLEEVQPGCGLFDLVILSWSL